MLKISRFIDIAQNMSVFLVDNEILICRAKSARLVSACDISVCCAAASNRFCRLSGETQTQNMKRRTRP